MLYTFRETVTADYMISMETTHAIGYGNLLSRFGLGMLLGVGTGKMQVDTSDIDNVVKKYSYYKGMNKLINLTGGNESEDDYKEWLIRDRDKESIKKLNKIKKVIYGKELGIRIAEVGESVSIEVTNVSEDMVIKNEVEKVIKVYEKGRLNYYVDMGGILLGIESIGKTKESLMSEKYESYYKEGVININGKNYLLGEIANYGKETIGLKKVERLLNYKILKESSQNPIERMLLKANKGGLNYITEKDSGDQYYIAKISGGLIELIDIKLMGGKIIYDDIVKEERYESLLKNYEECNGMVEKYHEITANKEQILSHHKKKKKGQKSILKLRNCIYRDKIGGVTK